MWAGSFRRRWARPRHPVDAPVPEPFTGRVKRDTPCRRRTSGRFVAVRGSSCGTLRVPFAFWNVRSCRETGVTLRGGTADADVSSERHGDCTRHRLERTPSGERASTARVAGGGGVDAGPRSWSLVGRVPGLHPSRVGRKLGMQRRGLPEPAAVIRPTCRAIRRKFLLRSPCPRRSVVLSHCGRTEHAALGTPPGHSGLLHEPATGPVRPPGYRDRSVADSDPALTCSASRWARGASPVTDRARGASPVTDGLAERRR